MISSAENIQQDSGFWGQAWHRFRYEKAGTAGACLILLLTLISFGSDFISQYDPIAHGDLLLDRFIAPGWDHLFGTDKFGRDIFSRVLYGGRISLTIGVSVVLLSGIIGLLYGTLSGYAGGRIDSVMMRILDFLLAFPMIFLLIMIITLFKVNHWYLIPVLGLTGWMETARLVRAEVLSIKTQEYILAAKGFGYSHLRIIFHHIIPNCVHIVFVSAPLKAAEVILLESALSFLGIGVQPPTPSWGSIINDGREALISAWWVAAFPGIFITITVLSFHLAAEGLKKSINPGK